MPQKEDGPEYSTEEELVKQFKTDPNKGLSSAYAAQKLEQDGKNELYKPPRPSLLMLFVAQLAGFIIVLLIIAAIASMVVNATGSEERRTDGLSYTTGIAIFVIVLLNAGIAAYTENQAGGALDALAKMSQPSITVVRDGEEVDLDTTLIVEGDIVLIATGDVVPADLRLINATDVKVAEMCLTGEPDDVAKNAKLKVKSKGHGEPEKLTPENMCFSSCSCTNGKGKGIVVATAMKTRIGEIASHLATEGGGKKRLGCLPDTSANQTPLQVNVERLGARIGIGAIVVCIIVFIIGIAINTRDPDNPESPSWLYMILIAVTLAVAAIPEGIPLCVTISLSIGSSSMVKEHVLVRKLAAVETLGSASVICSDKTGTLTEGKMTMVHMWSGGIQYDVSGKGFDPTIGKVTRSAGGADANADFPVKTTLLAGVLCCKTKLLKVRDPDTREEKWEPKGNSSEAPIVVAAKKVGFGTEECEKEYPLVLEVPFSSSRKMMLTVSDVARRDSMYQGGPKLPPGTKYLSVCKGAPNYIIDTCNTMVDESGNIQTLSASEKANIMKVVDDYSSQALRVLAIAINPMDSLPFDPDPNNTDVSTEEKFEYCRKQLTLVGLVASIDPERDGVKQSVQDARGASIRVVMITGDYLKTAVAIARNITILESYEGEDAACDCAKLRPGGEYLSDEEIDALTQQTRCFARAKPEDKMEIVKSFQRQGLVSAMTGDGVNDAPALHQADIGVAMGIQGTEVAKGASKMILTDDNFCSIVRAVEKGRVIYAGIQKFVAFIMSVHIAEVLQIFVCVVANIPVMRTPLQILFLILVTDLPPSIALGMEPGDKSILKARPRPKEEPIMLNWMWMSSIINGAILTAVIIVVYLISLSHFCEGAILQDDILKLDGFESKLANARTVAFISLVFSENIRAYVSRSFDKHCWVNFLGNKFMQYAIVAAEIALLCAVLIPFLSDKILGLQGIEVGIWGWLVSLIGPAGTLVLCELYKMVTQYQVQQYQEGLRIKAEKEEEEFKLKTEQFLAAKKAAGGHGITAHDVQITIHDGKQNGISKSDSHRGNSGKAGKKSWTKSLCCPFVGSARMA